MSIQINAINFPDETVRRYIQKKIANGSDILTDEMLATSSLYLSSDTDVFTLEEVLSKPLFTNLKGIEYFSNIRMLQIWSNYPTVWVYSKNLPEPITFNYNFPKLEELTIIGSNILSINFEKISNLRLLILHDNPFLENVNLTSLTNLDYLTLSGNNIKTLDLTHNSKLDENHCYLISHIRGYGITKTNNKSYPYEFDFRQIMNSNEISNIIQDSVTGKNGYYGTQVELEEFTLLSSFNNGIAKFKEMPSTIHYQYTVENSVNFDTILTGYIFLEPFIHTPERIYTVKKGKNKRISVECVSSVGTILMPSLPLQWSIVEGELPPNFSLKPFQATVNASNYTERQNVKIYISNY